MDLTSPITALPGIGSILAKKLDRLNIHTILDLLYHLPSRYEDRSLKSSIAVCQAGETVTVIAIIDSLKNQFTRSGKPIQKAQISDFSGAMPVVWFNQIYLTRTLSPGQKVALTGKVEFFSEGKTLISPEYEILSQDSTSIPTLIHSGRIIPIYPETKGISSKWLRSKIFPLLNSLSTETIYPTELLPPTLTSPSWNSALKSVHFPSLLTDIPPARHRLAFDELLLLQITSNLRKQQWQQTKLAFKFQVDQESVAQFIGSLPFTLTPSQNSSVREILGDLSSSKPMNRLLQGDVGSGKTVVAAIAAFIAHQNGLKTLLFAPTQILSHQHFQTLKGLLEPFDVSIELVTGSIKPKKITESSVIVGTHALLSSTQIIKPTGLVIIDEQHRFGVSQRALAASFGATQGVPHVLTMTATPIPRTIALTLHGDLDLSHLLELPTGRNPIKTWVVPETKRESSYGWISKQLTSTSSQAFWVCPFIEPSESRATIKAATQEFQRLQTIFPNFKLGLLHGRLKSSDKQKVIESFRRGEYDILVSTPVVEVGIDIPNATVMVIEGAHSFGLAQLHQLRGRVGRSVKNSFCLLFSPTPSTRLKAMEKSNSGLELAEIDFKLRGPGEIYGAAQHGLPEFKIATYDDSDLLQAATQSAIRIIPKLDSYPLLRQLVKEGKIEALLPN